MDKPNYQMKPMADALASRGRYGDSELVHINKAELAGIASLAPGGKLTINPDTGLQEAFLPFLAPILGSVLGTSFLPGLASAAGLGGLGSALAASPALAGAIGSGLATGLAENSLEKGLLSAVTGFGIGSALGGLGGAAGEAAEAAGTGIAKEGVKKSAEEAAKRAVGDISGAAAESGALSGLTNVGAGYVPEAGFEALLMNPAPSVADAAQAAAQIGPQLPTTFGGAMQQGMSNLGNIGANLGEVGKNMMTPGAMLPAIYGLSGIANLNAADVRRDAYNRRRGDSDAELQGWYDLMYSSFQPLSRYQYASGGITSVNPDDYNARRDGARKFAQGGPTVLQGTPAQRQAALRGPYVNKPPEDYRPGIDPEFMFFSQQPTGQTMNPPAQAPSAAPAVDPFAAVPSDVMNRYRQVARDLGNFHVQNDLSSRNQANRNQYMDEFAGLRGQYPGLSQLDESLNIDPQFRSTGVESYASGVLPSYAPSMGVQGGIGSLPYAGVFPRVGSSYAQFANESPRMMSEGGMARPPGAPKYDPETGLTEEEAEMLEKKRKFPGLMGSILPFGPDDLPDPVKKYTLWGGLLSGEGVPGFLKAGTLLGGMAEGGSTGGADQLISETIKAILGQHENGDVVIQMFVEKHGPEAFAELRTKVLKDVVPGAQTEGQMKGPGGGMDDQLLGMIGSSQPVALSTDEFVIPADVVSSLGDGSSDAGAKVLYEMMDSVRRAKGGSTNQPPPMDKGSLERIRSGNI